MDTFSLKTAFACIASDSQPLTKRLRNQLQTPFRAYHNEAHTLTVVRRVFAISGETPSYSLVAAALYHDAIYDPKERDNEAKSADFCREELSCLPVASSMIDSAARLILLTAHHQPLPDDSDGILLCDADLFILGSTPGTYETYRKAIRSEYAHVPEDAWRAGRGQVLTRFLERPRIFHGDWSGVAAHEAQARRNIADEIAFLSPTGQVLGGE